MPRERKRQAQHDTVVVEPEEVKEKLTEIENDELNQCLAYLKPNQLKSAMLEASGTSKQLIAAQLGLSPQTITSWKNDINYRKVIDINLALLDRQGREFRVKQVKNIIAPAYIELAKRMNDPVELANMEVMDIAKILKIMTNEIRMDLNEAADSGSEYSELTDLQKRRNHIYAMQNSAIDDLESNSNIIQLPIKKVG